MPRPRLNPPRPSGDPEPLRPRVEAIGKALREGFGACLEATAGRDCRSSDLARILGIQPVLASRVLRAVEHVNPCSVVFHAPGPEPLRDALEGFSRVGAPDEAVLFLLRAIESFDGLIKAEFGDLRALEAALAPWVTGGLAALAPRQRLAIHRASMETSGLEVTAASFSVAFVPASEGSWRSVRISRLLGITRWLPEAPFSIVMAAPEDEAASEVEGLDGVSYAEGGLEALRQDSFGIRPPAPLAMHLSPQGARYDLLPTGFGAREAVDLNLVERARDPSPIRRPTLQSSFGVSTLTGSAVEHCLLEILLPRGTFAPLEPKVVWYSTLARGVVGRAGEAGREDDLRAHLEECEVLELGDAAVDASTHPRHRDLLYDALERSEADPQDFLLYRVASTRPCSWMQVFLSWLDPELPRERWIPSRELYL